MLTICEKTKDEVISLAAGELCATLTRMGYTGGGELALGLFADFSLVPVGQNPVFDDEFAIEFHAGRGYIAGSNPRSVLIGVYRFLEYCGARWPRPGKDGAYLPSLDHLPGDISLRTAAAKRHRAICIEGAVSLENVLDLIEWMPKVGFNAYYVQFRDGFIFFDRWYSHRGSTVKEAEPFSVETSLAYIEKVKAAVKARGLLLHAVGHGWTCEPFGVPNHGWDAVNSQDIPDSYRAVCAQVNGKRDVWMQMPLATNLCYSNPYVQETMAQGVVDYLKENPSVDVLHFWLGDYYNNTCECEECRKYPVADYYIQILNEIDRRLSAEGIDTKIVFLIYYDLLPTPIKERLENPDRFILMFAPITRTFADAFPGGFTVKETPPYQINQIALPSSVEENLAYLWQWEQIFSGDTFDFDYHLMWDHIFDAGGEGISRVLYDDIRHYDALGLGGLVSCQLQRNAFPTSLAMTVMGKTLWDPGVDFDALRHDLYAATFGGEAAPAVADYLATLSRCFDVGAIRFGKKLPEGVLATLMRQALQVMEAFAPTVEANLAAPDPCHAQSWRLLAIHRRLYTPLAQCVLAHLAGDKEEAARLQKAAAQIAWEEEDTLAPVLDCHFFDSVTRSRICLP